MKWHTQGHTVDPGFQPSSGSKRGDPFTQPADTWYPRLSQERLFSRGKEQRVFIVLVSQVMHSVLGCTNYSGTL